MEGLMVLGQRLRQLRKGRHWTQQDLERESGVAQGIITNIETGRTPNPTAQTVQRLADALEVPVDTLLNDTEPPIDISMPPVDLLRAAHFSDQLIARLIESWARQSEGARLEVIARAKRLKKLHEENDGVLNSLLVIF
jgi:transcriptional regulator with XRE-family HTH domain